VEVSKERWIGKTFDGRGGGRGGRMGEVAGAGV